MLKQLIERIVLFKSVKSLPTILPALFLGLFSVSFVSMAAEKPVLTIYTYDSFTSEYGPGPAVKAAFEKTCNCELQFVAAVDGVTLLNKIKTEGASSPADIVLGLDNNLLQAAVDTGLFAPSNVNLQKINMPFGWSTNLFVPYDYGFFSFVYDKNRTTDLPKSLEELVYSDKPWKVIYQDPRTSTPGLGLLLWMQKVFDDKAADAWQHLAKKTVTVTKGWSEAYELFLKGESDFVLSYTTSPAYHIHEEKKDNYAALDLAEGHYVQIEVAGKLAASKHPELADKFMQFILTPEFQTIIPVTNWMYPVIDVQVPEAFHNLPLPQDVLEFGAVEVDAGKANWIKTWQTAVSQ